MPTPTQHSNVETYTFMALAAGALLSLYGLYKMNTWESEERKKNLRRKRQENNNSNKKHGLNKTENKKKSEDLFVIGSQATTMTPEKQPRNGATSTINQENQNNDMPRYNSATDSGNNTPPRYDDNTHQLVRIWSTGIKPPIAGQHTPPVKQLNSLFPSAESVGGDHTVSPLQLERTAAQFPDTPTAGSKG